MRVKDIQKYFAEWTPKDIAWEKDNVGLQVGDPEARVSGVLACLDVTSGVLAEARRRKTNLVVSHHPLLFRPPKSISTCDEVGSLIQQLVKSGINLYSAHTNLDFARGGTSFALARALGLQGVEFLHRPYQVQTKIVTFVPGGHADRVAKAMAGAGAGRIGNYDHCSFRLEGTGTFRGREAATPTVGKKGVRERVPEVRLEMIASRWHVPGVLAAMKAVHPYEEVAYEVYPTENFSNDYGMGVIGALARPVTLRSFLHSVKKALGARRLRGTGRLDSTVRRVAACGGSGSELLGEAVRQGAEVFITADIKYHAFHEADGKIALIDAGHYETEHPVVHEVVKRLREFMKLRGVRVPVRAATTSTNPVFFM